MYGDIKEYPPTVNAMNILAEKGWKVTVFNLIEHERNIDKHLHETINVRHIGRLQPGIRNVLNFIKAFFMIFFHCLTNRPKWILSYDGISVFASFMTAKILRIKWAYHQHDYWDPTTGWLKFPRWCEMNLARYADSISFPQQERANIFKTTASVKKDILLVFNGPRTTWAKGVEPAELFKDLKKKGYNILIYQGGWARRFLIQNIIKALPQLDNVFFIILGKRLGENIKEYYESVAAECGVTDRVFLKENVPYFEIPSYTAYSDIGVAKMTFDKSDTINNLLLVGASNKLMEYYACGLPVLGPQTEINKHFIEKEGRGHVCDPDSPDDIANAVRKLLENKEKFAQKNLKDFEEKLNFDIQFDKLLAILEKN